MTHNQFESSIRFIYKGVPRFIRLSYEVFLTVENELYRSLTEAYKTNPDAVNTLIKTTFRTGDFNLLAMIDRLFNDAECANIRSYILNASSCKVDSFSDNSIPGDDYRKPTYSGAEEDRFNSIDFGDIVAPVNLIEPCITALTGFNSGNFPTMMFELIRDYRMDSGYTNPYSFKEKSNYDQFMNPSVIRNSMGQTNVFDCLQTSLRIDINNLFSKFFCYPVGTLGTLNGLDMYTDLHNMYRDESSSAKIIADISKASLTSAVSTYLVYAGKLCGSKKDIYDWMYASFVRESVEQLDKGNYPTSVDISTITGHTVSDEVGSKNTPGANNLNNKVEIDNDIARKGVFDGKDDSYSKNLMYKHIRLLYSNWATVINLITQLSARQANREDVIRAWDKRDNVNTNKESEGRSDIEYIKLAEQTLYTYIGARFATYNTAAQYTGEAFISNIEFIKISKARVLDSCVKSIIEECCLPKKEESERRFISDFFIANSDKVQGILSANELTKNMLADLFMMCAYLSMLTYAHDHSGSILDQSDPITGKNNRELFEDIYFSLKRRIHDVINSCTQRGALRAILNTKISSDPDSRNTWNDQYKDYSDVIKRAFVAVRDYSSDWCDIDKNNSSEINRIFSRVADSTYKLETSDVIKKIITGVDCDVEAYEVRRIFTDLFIIPPITSFVKVKLELDYMRDTSIGSSSYSRSVPNEIFTRSTSLFPKNKVTVATCTQTEFIPSRIFSSVEAADETLNMMDEATDPESTWAHMSYNEIGAIGGAVHDLEDVTCPPDDTSVSIATLGVQAENDIPPVSTTDSDDERLIIGTEAYAEKVRHDTRVQCIEAISNHFNNLFDKIVLKR